MTDTPDFSASVREDLQLLSRDLVCISGTLEEIATVWRRAQQRRPDLPLGLPLRLETVTRQLTVIVENLADAAPRERPDLALLVTEHLFALVIDLAVAEGMTCGAGISPVGDADLWTYLSRAVQQARARALILGSSPPGSHGLGRPQPVLNRT